MTQDLHRSRARVSAIRGKPTMSSRSRSAIRSAGYPLAAYA